jgi:CheY-like chemotaxis protein
MPHRILLVDDDPDAQFLAARVLRKCQVADVQLTCAPSGEEAIAYMIGEGRFSDRVQFPFPTLLITDLHMPHGDGLSVLEFMQKNPAWSVVPRVVFTSCTLDDDVRTAFMLGASAYHLKPLHLHETERCLTDILTYWGSSLVPPVDCDGRLLISAKSGLRGTRYPPAAGADQMHR